MKVQTKGLPRIAGSDNINVITSMYSSLLSSSIRLPPKLLHMELADFQLYCLSLK